MRVIYHLAALTAITSDYDTPEWGFAKGRRNINEKIYELCDKRILRRNWS